MHNTGLILDAESINDLKTLSIKAENVGFHSVWETELYRTSFQQIASTAQNTTKIRLGTAVSNNIEQAKKDVKATIVFYATVKTYKDPIILHGFENNLKEIRDAYF